MLERSSTKGSEQELETYYSNLENYSVGPLWQVPWVQNRSMVQEPKSRAAPHVWSWKDLRPQALKAAELVGTEQAERRALMLLNPGLSGRVATTNSLFAAFQIVLPGEVAAAHRHTPSALRFMIESSGGYTTVEGERLRMFPGDLVLTPNWTWHDHGNDTDQPMIWMDGLDLPLVHLLESAFYDSFSEDVQPITRASNSSLAKYGQGGLRPSWEQPTASHSPLMHYPWDQTWEALKNLAPLDEGSQYDGTILEYTNPATGGPVMPTMACHVQLLMPGQGTLAHRHTSSTIYHVVRGRGSSLVDGQQLDWEEKDVFCVPGWAYHEHQNTSSQEPAVLFSFSDSPVLRAISLLREEAHPQGHQ